MHTFFAGLAGVALAALSQAPSIPELAGRLLSEQIDPVTYDYGEIRFSAPSDREGWERLSALERAASARVVSPDIRDGDRLNVEQTGCAYTAILGGARMARGASDRAAYDAARARAFVLYEEGRRRLEAGLARAESELEAALVHDRVWRDLMVEPRSGDASVYAAEFELDMLYRGLCRSDLRNTAYLRRLFADEARFFDMVYGEDRPARSVLVQHAPHSLQTEILQSMERRADFGDDAHERRAQAYLTDRVRVRDGLPQLYATQGRCENGRWVFVQPVDLAAAEARRAEAGLEPVQATRARQAAGCRSRLGASTLP